MAVKFKFNLVDDSHVEMEVEGIKEVLVASDLEQLQQALAAVRAGMSPPVASDPDLLSPVAGVVDPRWFVSADAAHEGAVLQFRDPGRGWVAYLVPAQWCQRMAELILETAAPIQAPPPGSIN